MTTCHYCSGWVDHPRESERCIRSARCVGMPGYTGDARIPPLQAAAATPNATVPPGDEPPAKSEASSGAVAAEGAPRLTVDQARTLLENGAREAEAGAFYRKHGHDPEFYGHYLRERQQKETLLSEVAAWTKRAQQAEGEVAQERAAREQAELETVGLTALNEEMGRQRDAAVLRAQEADRRAEAAEALRLKDLGRCGDHPRLGNVAERKDLKCESTGCGKPFVFDGERYRCTDCDVVLHKHCALEHFAVSQTQPCSEALLVQQRNLMQQVVEKCDARVASATQRLEEVRAGILKIADDLKRSGDLHHELGMPALGTHACVERLRALAGETGTGRGTT